jgi:integration host factor subunit beta
MVEALGRGERVELRGLGSFEAPLWKGRKGRDWKSGRTVDLPPLRRLIFRPGRSLRPRKIPEKTADPSGQYWMFEEDGKPADKKP